MTRTELMEAFEESFAYQEKIGNMDFTKLVKYNQDPVYTHELTYWMWLAYVAAYENHVGHINR